MRKISLLFITVAMIFLYADEEIDRLLMNVYGATILVFNEY